MRCAAHQTVPPIWAVFVHLGRPIIHLSNSGRYETWVAAENRNETIGLNLEGKNVILDVAPIPTSAPQSLCPFTTATVFTPHSLQVCTMAGQLRRYKMK